MTWIKLDDKCPRHPKVDGLSDRAFREWVHGICYASAYLTDGVLPHTFLRGVPAKVRAELVAAGLWMARDEQMVIHDYLTHQRSKDEIKEQSSFDARRAAMRKDPTLRAALHERDCDHCRYCDRAVSWTDRRSPAGATYDHVIPRGPETIDNLVVACRRCNTRKGNRTPEQAGMELLVPRSELEQIRRGPIPEAETDTERTTKSTAPVALGTQKSSTWKRSIAIAHAVMDDCPDSQDWTPEFKGRCSAQGIDYGQPGGATMRPLYARALDYVEAQRKRRTH